MPSAVVAASRNTTEISEGRWRQRPARLGGLPIRSRRCESRYASGTPAIGLNVAGPRDALVDGELGTVVAETELSATIAHLLSDPNRILSGWPMRCMCVSVLKLFADNARNAWNCLMETA